VGGMDIPLINKFAGGYTWGANYTNPACNVTFNYPWDFGDPVKGKTAGDTLYDLGCDVIFAAAGATGLGVFDSVKEKNATSAHPLWVIGVDGKQMFLGTADPDNPDGPSLCMTSMLKKVDVAVYEAIKDACHDDDFAGGVKVFDIANGGLDFEVNSTLLEIDQDILDVVYDLKTAISNGTIDMDPYDHKWWIP
ncbi:MAG: BMP family ABC transporter substrate-binding protein, partial [Candidatus Thorarchaeota archaeon]|nr:BMP family ABC transporter substrate-binding protein [Candidatus Thorarchaeota archaeon]